MFTSLDLLFNTDAILVFDGAFFALVFLLFVYSCVSGLPAHSFHWSPAAACTDWPRPHRSWLRVQVKKNSKRENWKKENQLCI